MKLTSILMNFELNLRNDIIIHLFLDGVAIFLELATCIEASDAFFSRDALAASSADFFDEKKAVGV